MEYKIEIDMNVRSDAGMSGVSTIKENIAGAKSKRLRGLTIVESGPGSKVGVPEYFFKNVLAKLSPRDGNIQMLKGIEVNILGVNQNDVDITDKTIFQTLDWSIAHFNPRFGVTSANRELITKSFLCTAQNKNIMALGEVNTFDCDYALICSRLKEDGKVIELNESTLTSEFNIKAAKRLIWCCKENRNPIVVSSGATYCDDVGVFTKCREVLNEVEFPQELILNTSIDVIKQYIDIYKNRFLK